MYQLTTTAIVLSRTNYGEADRIITVLTPDYGRLRLMARGVRRVKSKLAGGIELFSVSHISFIRGRGEISTLVSSRLQQHYSHIVSDIQQVQLGYELIKLLNKAIEDEAEKEYFELLAQAFVALDDLSISEDLIRTWFAAQLLRLGGHMPNLRTDTQSSRLSLDSAYEFDFTAFAFMPKENGRFSSNHIKFLRLIFSGNLPNVLMHVKEAERLLPPVGWLVNLMWSSLN